MKRLPTGPLNRGDFFREAEECCRRAVHAHALSVIVFDIDRLDAINREFGGSVGDRVLGMIAEEASHQDSIFGRLAGEEFVMLLEEHALPDAVAIAESLRRRIANRALRIGDRLIRVTCSFGVDEWEFGETIDDLLRRADSALYQAKAAGRNRVVSYRPVQSGAGGGRTVVSLRLGDR